MKGFKKCLRGITRCSFVFRQYHLPYPCHLLVIVLNPLKHIIIKSNTINIHLDSVFRDLLLPGCDDLSSTYVRSVQFISVQTLQSSSVLLLPPSSNVNKSEFRKVPLVLCKQSQRTKTNL